MINYFTRPGGAFIKIDTDTEIVNLVLNMPTQKTLSVISNNPDYYNNAISSSADWPVSDQTTFDTNRTEVLNYINSL